MEQCLTVLARVQPATRQHWERACWEDLRKRGVCCLTIDMEMAIRACINDGFVINTGDSCQLVGTLFDALSRLAGQRRESRARRQQDERERRGWLRGWATTTPEQELRATLLQIAEDESRGRSGDSQWELFEDLLRHAMPEAAI